MTDAHVQLRQIAAGIFRSERSDHTLQPTALAHEAYIRLRRSRSARWASRAHFFGAAARAMKQILIDHARALRAKKRAGSLTRVDLTADVAVSPTKPEQFLAVTEALERLRRVNQRQGTVVELRFYAGLTIREVAEILGLGITTVKAEWAAAREWLKRELSATA